MAINVEDYSAHLTSMRSLFFSQYPLRSKGAKGEIISPSSIYSVDHKNKKGAEFFGGFKIII